MGYQFPKGHPPYYRGGAVPGHRPTCVKGPGMNKNHPNWKLGPYAFGQPKGEPHRKMGGNRPKDKERRCLEDLQAGQDPAKLRKKYPAKMVARLEALLEASSDPNHRNFLGSFYLVREILGKHRGERSEPVEAPEPDSIQVVVGRIDVPMPGAENEEAPGSPPEDEPEARTGS